MRKSLCLIAICILFCAHQTMAGTSLALQTPPVATAAQGGIFDFWTNFIEPFLAKLKLLNLPSLPTPSATPTPPLASTPAATPNSTPKLLGTPIPVPPASTPASVPTSTPISAPPSGSSWWKPQPGLSWDIQFTGNINYNVNVQALDIDLFDTTASTIASLHARGVKVICYFSAGSYEDWRPDANKFPSSVRGKNLDGWPGENWLDAGNLDVLMPVMIARMDMAVQKKCDAVDLDNMDIYQQDSGFSISYAENLAYAKALVKEAHKRNLAIGLKNNLDQIKDLVNDYDFAINESCYDYSECDMLKPFIQQGKPVLGIEYNKSTSQFCAAANASNYDFLKKNQSLDQARQACR